ncbi:MAG: EscU/YscU/HrcU family type III secretion system export apparatus switch protein [Nitrospinota bacterium]
MEPHRRPLPFIPKEAVALRYEPRRESAPRLVAKGRGELAERILELARIHNIPIREDSDLVRLLGELDLEEEIPPNLYKVIAEILAFIYFVNEKWKREKAA